MISIGNLKQKLNQMSIAQKLIYGFGVICVFILINAVLTVGTHIYTRGLQAQETEDFLPVKANLDVCRSHITESQRLTVSWVLIDEHNPGTPDKVRLANLVERDFDAVFDEVKIKTRLWDQQFIDTLAIVEEKIHGLFDLERRVMNNLSDFDSYDDLFLRLECEGLVENGGDVDRAVREIVALMESLGKMCDVKCADIKSSISFYNTLQLLSAILMSILVMIIAIVVGRYLYFSIVEPLKKGVVFAEAIGRGDLTATVDVDQDDEIGVLSKSLQMMVNNLKQTVVSIGKNADDLVDSGTSLRGSSQKLSKGASEQAASAEEVSTAIEQMVANIDQNTENAIATEKLTSATVENVNLSSQYSGEAAEAMQTISEKISIISDIAFQTNILALNAAVEAVRAGEQGRGFSVVAAEVRKLAERSKQAANEIVSLVNKGLKVTQLAGEKAKALVPDIQKTTVLIKEITAASVEQKTGAEQINMAMQNLNVITQENASSSDELTNSSIQLSGLANSLKKAVGYFKLDENDVLNAAQEQVANEVASDNNASNVTTDDKGSSDVSSASLADDDAESYGGVKIDLGNVGGKEFDLDNYEKF